MIPPIATEYPEARAGFLRLAEAGGLRTVHSKVAYESQPELFIDFAFVKRDPAKALALISGTHGIEGYAGSAIQQAVLRELPGGGPSLLFVHALNPYGMALYRRANGSNVDLNRSFNLSPVSNPDYAFFRSYLNPSSRLEFLTGAVTAAVARLRLGESRTRQAIAAGQMDFPEGIFFTGLEVPRELRLLQDFLKSHFSGFSELTVLDLHTGLGEFGGEMLFVDHDREQDSPAHFARLFGRDADVPDASGGSYEIHGRSSDAIRSCLPGTRLRYCLQEFGTRPAGAVIGTLRRENFSWRFRPPGSPPPARLRDAMLDAFLPAEEFWRRKLLELGVLRWQQCHKGLC